ncbi:DUF1134 domain-containing protein [Sphingomonas antarctica]|uniref:DUF1134 domain-containing protein n=1 Tax=Sphingomonas antarctica TaxID=2040274 RepID=UPI0039EA426B
MRKFGQAIAAALLMWGTTAPAQMQTVDPDKAAQTDTTLQPGERGYAVNQTEPAPPPPPANDIPPTNAQGQVLPPASGTKPATYQKNDVIGAAEGVFGRGAEGLGGIIEKILKDQGEPVAYIAGREASGAIGIGLRYGSGTMTHKIEGQRPVYWTGPSIGFDLGGDATKVFTLVYNLDDTADLYRRYPQVEGRAYFIGGFSATYLRRGNVVLIPVRAGVGMRLGANIGYMKFSEKSRILPF